MGNTISVEQELWASVKSADVTRAMGALFRLQSQGAWALPGCLEATDAKGRTLITLAAEKSVIEVVKQVR